jgi:hypothetical protein
MQTPEIKANTEKFIDWTSVKFENGSLDNESLVEVIKLSDRYLNLATIADYAKRHGLSYPGAVLRVESGKVQVVEIAGVKLIIDND